MKMCTKCNTNKPLDDFPKSSSSKDGKHSYCKRCMVKQRMEKYEYKKDRMRKTSTHKECRVCRELKPHSEYKKRGDRSNRSETYCMDCRKYLGTERVLARYQMTVDDYASMLKKQNFVCAICKKEDDNKRLAVDHDHACCEGNTSCGKCVRALLCSRCNKTLGMVKDDIKLLQSMIDYIKIF